MERFIDLYRDPYRSIDQYIYIHIYLNTHTTYIYNRILIIKKNEILPFAGKLMDPEGITLSK